MIRRRFTTLLALAGVGAMAARATDARAQADAPVRKPDLADAAAGTYVGDVISDSKGSSQSNVTLTVTRVGKNIVRVTSDYPRLPVIDVPLTSAMGKILQQRGNSVFLLDRAANRLDVSFLNEVSWSGARR